MRKWERLSAVIGASGGAAIAVEVANVVVIAPTLWLSGILGAIGGLGGGAFGQNFIEGIVIAILSTAILAAFLWLRIEGPINELVIGYFCGSAFGWLTHGVCGLRS